MKRVNYSKMFISAIYLNDSERINQFSIQLATESYFVESVFIQKIIFLSISKIFIMLVYTSVSITEEKWHTITKSLLEQYTEYAINSRIKISCQNCKWMMILWGLCMHWLSS